MFAIILLTSRKNENKMKYETIGNIENKCSITVITGTIKQNKGAGKNLMCTYLSYSFIMTKINISIKNS